MPEPKRIGKYEILEELGRGGFAAVYKARDTELERVVALKVLHPYWSEDPGFAARFRREARTAANLRHSNIVTVYEAGEAAGQLYIAMEYLPGRTLRALLETEGALSLERALPILDQVADALDYAHKQGVIHRDVKPVNVMIEETGRGVGATLMDFGLVKALEGSTAITSQGTLLGSPEYMAPEQADPDRVSEIGPATDRYALGIMAYQMLTGQVPFAGNTPSTLVAHLQKAPPDPQGIRASLPVNVSQVLLKMLAKTPGDRYPSATAFVAALRNALTESQERRLRPKAEPESKPRKPVPIWVWAVVGALVLVIACGGVITSIVYRLAFTPKATATRALALSTPGAIATPTLTLARTPAPAEIRTRSMDGMVMVYVPGGTFLMGSADSDKLANFDEKPQHPVTLDAFWVDRTEVTNAQYKKCVQAGACKASEYPDSWSTNGDNQPVVGVSWYDAKAYCQWTGAALPTEAQWERAARGTDGRIYPWGDQPATCEYAVMVEQGQEGCGKSPAWPVGSKPKGVSPYGALDMAGNVSEWVEDWLGDHSYSAVAQTNPTGPMTGTIKVLRGGSWYCTDAACVRAADRDGAPPETRNTGMGFRCLAAEPGPATPAAAPEPALGATQTRSADGMVMVYVPGGPFLMGSAESDKYASEDEKPQRSVTLDAFWIDKTEVTNAQYDKCVKTGVCKASEFANDPGYNGADQPVGGVGWYDAKTYCQWAGAALPAEAQWEKAARGTDGRIYPWGNQPATCDYAVMNDGKGDGCGNGGHAWPAGSKPKGASPYGALDMAGNVWEWVEDWYAGYPGATYQDERYGQRYKVLRGGGVFDAEGGVRAAGRARHAPGDLANYIEYGFRCAVVPGMVTPPVTREPVPGATRSRPADSMTMVYVPGGDLMMGSADDDPIAQSDEKPRHDVYLDAFWIDRTEVTNAQYRQCVQSDKCRASVYADRPDLNGDDQPVTGVNWDEAAAYCRWAGAALPTEAQWEKAAKGADYQRYPWGAQTATCEFAVLKDYFGYGCGKGEAAWPVGSKPQGASPYGALDMAGNVSEWVADWYGAYPSEYQVNPTGPAAGTKKVIRGGSWNNTWPNARIAARETDVPDNHADNLGFRCAAVGP